ncbi:MAG: ParB/RepB/Spo0J family partition protein [Clostridia bacterium]|nr:ParB/RepB/Spo0J family partition protein [Clostridia bacterium]
MAAKKGGLGRGFEALFEDNSAEDLSPQSVTTLPVGELTPNRDQPRKNFDDEALNDLTESIREHGVLQPILVRPASDGSYRIVAGERRYRAAINAGLKSVPVIVKVLSDQDAALIALIENLQREDLSPLEEAEGIRRLMQDFGLTQEQAGARLGRSRPAVANALRLLELPDEIKAMVGRGELSAGHARTLLGLEDEDAMIACAHLIAEKRLSVRATETLVDRMKKEKKPKKEKPRRRDAFYTEAEISLSDALGRAVEIKESKKGGRLVIEFFDKEDLQKLTKLFEE